MTTAAGWFRTRTEFDELDRPVRTSSGAQSPQLMGAGGVSEIEAAYGANGFLVSVAGSYGPIITGLTRNVLGQPVSTRYGDAAGTVLSRGYDAVQRLKTYRVLRPALSSWNLPPDYVPPADDDPPTRQRTLEDLSFDYLPSDLVQSVHDLRTASEWPSGGKPATRTFDYDALRRVTKIGTAYPGGADAAALAPKQGIPASSASRPVLQVFSYDWQGNSITAPDLGTVVNGGAGIGPNQLASAAAGNLDARYDEAGNVVQIVLRRERV